MPLICAKRAELHALVSPDREGRAEGLAGEEADEKASGSTVHVCLAAAILKPRCCWESRPCDVAWDCHCFGQIVAGVKMSLAVDCALQGWNVLPLAALEVPVRCGGYSGRGHLGTRAHVLPDMPFFLHSSQVAKCLNGC